MIDSDQEQVLPALAEFVCNRQPDSSRCRCEKDSNRCPGVDGTCRSKQSPLYAQLRRTLARQEIFARLQTA